MPIKWWKNKRNIYLFGVIAVLLCLTTVGGYFALRTIKEGQDNTANENQDIITPDNYSAANRYSYSEKTVEDATSEDPEERFFELVRIASTHYQQGSYEKAAEIKLEAARIEEVDNNLRQKQIYDAYIAAKEAGNEELESRAYALLEQETISKYESASQYE